MELVNNINGNPCTTSRLIAFKFEKEHKSVLRSIENLECSADFRRRNFALSYYTNEQNKEMPEFIITENGFAFLAMGFTGANAAKFKEDYIGQFSEMRKSLKPAVPSLQEMRLLVMEGLIQEVEETKLQLVKANETIIEQAPIVQYANEVLSSPDLISTTIIAKDLGMSASNLNKILRSRGVLYKRAETWVLYSKYQDKGYTHTKTHTHYDSKGDKRTSIHTYWTEKGRQFIHEFISNGIKTA